MHCGAMEKSPSRLKENVKLRTSRTELDNDPMNYQVIMHFLVYYNIYGTHFLCTINRVSYLC